MAVRTVMMKLMTVFQVSFFMMFDYFMVDVEWGKAHKSVLSV